MNDYTPIMRDPRDPRALAAEAMVPVREAVDGFIALHNELTREVDLSEPRNMAMANNMRAQIDNGLQRMELLGKVHSTGMLTQADERAMDVLKAQTHALGETFDALIAEVELTDIHAEHAPGKPSWVDMMGDRAEAMMRDVGRIIR